LGSKDEKRRAFLTQPIELGDPVVHVLIP
jgi:hypothetical protein